MDSSRPVLYCHVKVTQQIQPSSLLTDLFPSTHQVCKSSVVGLYEYGLHQEVLAELFQPPHDTQHFPARNTVSALGVRQSSAGVNDHLEPHVLFLLNNCPKGPV